MTRGPGGVFCGSAVLGAEVGNLRLLIQKLQQKFNPQTLRLFFVMIRGRMLQVSHRMVRNAETTASAKPQTYGGVGRIGSARFMPSRRSHTGKMASLICLELEKPHPSK